MSKKKYIFGSISLLVAAVSVWYFFVKPYDYQIRFEKKTSPGTIFNHVDKWVKALAKSENTVILNATTKPYTHSEFDLKIKDSIISMDWDFESITDSTTQITISVRDHQNSAITRFKNLVSNPPLKKMLLNKTSKFNRSLNNLLELHKVKIIGEADIPKGFYAFIASKSTIDQKANTMIKLNVEILYWLKKQNIEVIGRPILVTTSWEVPKDSISFDFMFPIQKKDSLPFHESIKFKSHGGGRGIKAIFNGNYRISDRAWFSLYEFAKRNNIAIETLPIEYFRNDPLEGSNAIDWITEIYLPLKPSNE
ncbi:GyrI-like domain-containing protein [Spongiimicrobium salis]|uniref:GyrI-like domain-containing protein n=1 Tax=Spongiimicrobium salis TaxID=1667022 RepID=UPI00374CD0A5